MLHSGFAETRTVPDGATLCEPSHALQRCRRNACCEACRPDPSRLPVFRTVPFCSFLDYFGFQVSTSLHFLSPSFLLRFDWSSTIIRPLSETRRYVLCGWSSCTDNNGGFCQSSCSSHHWHVPFPCLTAVFSSRGCSASLSLSRERFTGNHSSSL